MKTTRDRDGDQAMRLIIETPHVTPDDLPDLRAALEEGALGVQLTWRPKKAGAPGQYWELFAEVTAVEESRS